ncbi:MAG: PAS domain S-box protein, partial [Kiritimatiellaceae bacterium]|nr:PAS domain S-box protein [Kiritimatiellaceae bacterium]
MFYIDLIHILALLVTLSALSGMIKTRKTDRPYYNLVWQGLLFGSMAVLGMIHPLTLQPGLFFDGGSVILSLCGLFFGYVSVGIASSMAIFCRLLQGGIGTLMGIIVIVSSAVIGLLTQRYLKQHQEFSIPHLWCFGLLVHIAMLLATLALPSDLITETLKTISLPVLIFYPIATVFAGKVILDQLARSRMINELTASEEELISTLYSLGDALICTNVDGIIHHMNPEAEHLTGWTVAEATGQRLESIFKLSTPGMLKQPENPTQRILRAGQAVTLSQNMMLISKK